MRILDAFKDTLILIEIVQRTGETRLDVLLNQVRAVRGLSEKISTLNLTRITGAEMERICEYYKDRGVPELAKEATYWEYVFWKNGTPFFYSTKFLMEHEVAEIQNFIDLH